MTVFITSDTHLSHANILKYEPGRPGATIQEHDEIIITAWNETVGHNDTVYHLGDFAFARIADVQRLFDRLHGQKILIPGNHDDKDVRNKLGWKDVLDRLTEIKIDKKLVVLCHYPMLVWNKSHYGSLHLHGHSHGHITQTGTRFDVGIDAVGQWKENHRFGAPVPLEDIFAIKDNKVNEAVDHHGRDEMR